MFEQLLFSHREQHKPLTFNVYMPFIYFIVLSFYRRGRIASYASAGIVIADMSVCLSICLCVRHTLVLYVYKNERHDFFTDGEPEHYSFCRSQVHPEIRKGPQEPVR